MSDETSPADSEEKKKTNWAVRLIPVAVILAGLAAAYAAGLHKYLSLETLEAQRDSLKAFVSDHAVLAFLGYILLYALATAFLIPGAGWITIAGGFVFGLIGGTLATVTGATLGATALFFVARTSIGEPLRQRAGPFLKKLEAGFREDSLSYMFFLRLMPAVPFPVANIAPALLGAKAGAFILTTAVGIIPGVLAYSWIGKGLDGILASGGDEGLSHVTSQVVPPLLALAVVSLIPVVIKRFRKKPVLRETSDDTSTSTES